MMNTLLGKDCFATCHDFLLLFIIKHLGEGWIETETVYISNKNGECLTTVKVKVVLQIMDK